MAKLVTMVRIRKDRAEKLRDKSIDLTIEKRERITEADIINYLIDEYTDRVKIDDLGLKIEGDE